MKNLVSLLFLLPFLYCCKSKKDTHEERIAEYLKKHERYDFLDSCEIIKHRGSIGALQGTKHPRDSTNFLCFIDNYDVKETYNVVFLFRSTVAERKTAGYDGVTKAFSKACENDFADFDCFVFVLPMLDPEKQPDIHASTLRFPANVKVYSRINNVWHHEKTVKANSFEEYSNLRFNTMYRLN